MMERKEPFRYVPAELCPDQGTLPIRSTAGAFLVRDGRILLEKRPSTSRVYPGLWDTPGGHLEAGESPEDALIREMGEELSIRPLRFILGAVQDDIDPGSGSFYRHFVYIVRDWEGTPRTRENRRVQWFSLQEALDLEPLNPLVGAALMDFMNRGWLGATRDP
jgi:8-oxo-dGTP diphosphatase